MIGESELNARGMRDARPGCRQEQRLRGTSRADLMQRIGAAAGLAGIIGAFALALSLQPDPQGMGTHQQLGMPPCTMYMLIGLPCPTCGMTTAFAHMVRLQVFDAFRSQPFGVLVFLSALLSAGWCMATILRGRGPTDWLRRRRINVRYCVLVGIGLGLAAWAWKIAVVLMHDA